MITKRGRRLQRYDLQLIMCGDIVKDSNSYLKSRGSIEDFVSFREMITSQLQGKLWLYDEVRNLDLIDSRLENIHRFLNGFIQQPNEIDVDDLEPDDESVNTPLFSPFLDSNDDSDDGEVLNELEENGLESTGKNLVAIVRDVYVFVGTFTYIMDFVILEDIEEFILRDMVEVMMGKPFRKVTKLEYDCAKGLMSFTRIFDNYTFQIPRTILRFKNWGHVSWSQIPPVLVLSQRDLTNDFRNAYEKNKFMYKNCLNLDPEYQVDERSFFKENEKKIFTVAGDDVRIYPDGVVIFDKKKLGSSEEVLLDDSWRTI
ncbi:hypothetical protein Tco_0318524 [Tanacetum coccineum]